jgi:hypothetical protein
MWLPINGNWIGRHSGKSWSSYWLRQIKSFWIKPDSRQGTTLPDEYGNDAKILLPACASKTEGQSNANLRLKTGVVPSENSIIILRSRVVTLAKNREGCSAGLIWGQSDITGWRWYLAWGDKEGASHTTYFGTSNLIADTNWHIFIIYDKRLWVLDPDVAIDDDSISNVITTATPLINITTAAWVVQTNEMYLLGNFAYNIQADSAYSFAYFGTITDSVITWQKKFVFTNEFAAYDIINGTMSYFLTWDDLKFNGTNILFLSKKEYSEYGYDLLSLGHTKGYSANRGILSVPKTTGDEFIETLPEWFVEYNEIEGDENNHNACDSLIEFPANVMDRSDTTIFKDGARCINRAVILLTGTEGTATISINGIEATATFATNLGTTATNFINTNGATYAGIGYMYRSGNAIMLDSGVVSKISSVTITNASGDLAGTVFLIGGYDVDNPTRWHISELNYLLFKDWINDDYVGMHFPAFDANSVIEEDKILFKEFAVMGENKTGSALDNILKYTGDYNYI